MLTRQNLHGYQRRAEEHILENPYAALFLDMGLGKTVTTMSAIQQLIWRLSTSRVLIVAPKRVVETVWHAEAAKWEHLRGLRIMRVMGTEPQRRKALLADADIYIISRDLLAWLIALYGGTRVPFDMLVLDESSSFKNHASKRFKALKKVRGSFDRVVLLTGTPAPNSLIDLWSQMYMLDGGHRLGKNITAYREAYFRKGPSQFSPYMPQRGAPEAIAERISDVALSMKASDYLDMPARIDNRITIPMTPALRKQYKAFEREQVMELAGAEITAQSAAALVGKLMQFSSGAVYDAERGVHELHALKLDALEEVIEAAQGQPVLVAYAFQHDLSRIMHRLRAYEPRNIKERGAIDDWNAGRVRVMLAHPASAGHGLNLQHGGHIGAWFGFTYSLELYQQWNARLDRQGQAHVVTLHHLVLEGTIDEAVLAALSSKDDTQRRLTDAVKVIVEGYRD